MSKDRHHNSLVGKKRPDGTVWKVMHDNDAREMFIRWLKGEKSRDLKVEFGITGRTFSHQKYYHLKRLCLPFIQEVLQGFQEGGTRALMREYELDVFKANKLYLRSLFYSKHIRRQIDKPSYEC